MPFEDLFFCHKKDESFLYDSFWHSFPNSVHTEQGYVWSHGNTKDTSIIKAKVCTDEGRYISKKITINTALEQIGECLGTNVKGHVLSGVGSLSRHNSQKTWPLNESLVEGDLYMSTYLFLLLTVIITIASFLLTFVIAVHHISDNSLSITGI